MTSSQRTSFLSEVANGEVIPKAKLAYFQERLHNRIYDFVVSKFLEQELAGKLTRADLARRIQRKPEQVTRWLGASGNWTLDTVSDLLLGIGAEELDPASSSLLNRAARNDTKPEWLDSIDKPQGQNGLAPNDSQVRASGLPGGKTPK